jgi:hypothetical protein
LPAKGEARLKERPDRIQAVVLMWCRRHGQPRVVRKQSEDAFEVGSEVSIGEASGKIMLLGLRCRSAIRIATSSLQRRTTTLQRSLHRRCELAQPLPDAPAGRLEGADAYRAFMGPFVQMLTGSKLIAAFGDLQTALVMYDTETLLVKSAPGAECVTVSDGRITYSRFVFDRAPFDAARKNGG